MKIGIKFISLFLLWLSLISCFKDSECLDLRNNILEITFKKAENTEDDELEIINVWMAESQYTFSGGQSPVTRIDLPLNPAQNQQKIEFTVSDPAGPIYRNIEIKYDVRAQFESVDCEPKFFFSGLSVVSHDFLAIKVVNSLPQKSTGTANIEVVYR